MASAEATIATIAVEIVWSPAARQTHLQSVRLPVGSTLADALRVAARSGVADAEGRAVLEPGNVMVAAVWSRLRPLSYILRDGDRVELVRPLMMAPMEARRMRCEAAGGIRALRRRRKALAQRP